MPQFFLFFKLTFICFAVLLCNSTTYASPQISVLENVYLGEVNAGNSIRGNFLIKNLGDSNLEIFKVKPTCGCTIFTLGKKNLKPGEESKIEIEIKTKSKDINSEIWLFSNDPEVPEVKVNLFAKVFPSFKLIGLPNELKIGKISNPKTMSKEIQLSWPSSRNYSIKDVSSSLLGIKIKVSNISSNKKNLKINLDPSLLPFGKFAGKITITGKDVYEKKGDKNKSNVFVVKGQNLIFKKYIGLSSSEFGMGP